MEYNPTPTVDPQKPDQASGAVSTPPVQPQGGATQEQVKDFVTKAELDEFRRSLQSSTDKSIAAVKREVANQIKQIEQAYASAGIEITDEAKAKIKQKAIENVLLSPDDEKQSPAPSTENAPGQARPAETQERMDPVTAEAHSYLQAAGVSIDESDPEYKLIEQTSPGKFLRSVQAAINAKRERIGEPLFDFDEMKPAGTTPRLPTNIGGKGTYNANRIADIKDPEQLLSMAFSK